MRAYVDSSVVLRLVIGQPDALRTEWAHFHESVTSALTEVECLRTIDRFRLKGSFALEKIAARRAAVFEFLSSLSLIEVSREVLQRASGPFPTPLGSLDAIHLATALLWREQISPELTLATHDTALALAARASGLPTLG